jgi:hypothetical protein
VPHSTLLFAECVDTIKPSVPVPDFGTETLYFFRFVKEQYSLLVKKPELSAARLVLHSCRGNRGSRRYRGQAMHLAGSGGGERDRTDDLLLAKQALSQLSYTPD